MRLPQTMVDFGACWGILGLALATGCLEPKTGRIEGNEKWEVLAALYNAETATTAAGYEWNVIPQEDVWAYFLSDKMFRNGGLLLLFYNKDPNVRRLVPLEITPGKDLSHAKALALVCALSLDEGSAPTLAVVLFEEDGGVWYKTGAVPLRAVDPNCSRPTASQSLADAAEGVRLPLRSLKQAEFSQDTDGKLDLDKITKVWVGLVLDGSVRGSFAIRRAAFTDKPYRPTQPLRLTGDGPGTWSLAKDPAVEGKVSTPSEGSGGKACMRFEFTFPPRRHMYALPKIQLPEAEYDGYRALRLTYKATLPKGIDGLLVSLLEHDGSQYCARPAPTPSNDWRTVTLPFDTFKLGEWSHDENGQLDLEQLGAIFIGLHGTAQGDKAPGVIYAADVEVVP
jgi:hypothetical protein